MENDVCDDVKLLIVDDGHNDILVRLILNVCETMLLPSVESWQRVRSRSPEMCFGMPIIS